MISLSNMMGSLEPSPPPTREDQQSAWDIMASKDDGQPNLVRRAANILAAPDFHEAAGNLTQDPIDRARVAAAMERYGRELPDPTGAAQTAYAKWVNLAKGGKKADQVNDLWDRLVGGDVMSEQELEQLHSVMRAVDGITSKVNPGLNVKGIRVTGVDLEDDAPYARVEADDPEELVQSIPLDSAQIIKEAGPKLEYRVDSTGAATVTGNPSERVANQLRHMYPEKLQGGGYQWVPSHVRPVANVDKLRNQFQGDGHVVETYENSALAEVGGHPGMMPGNHLVVETAPEDHKTVLGLLNELGGAIQVKGVEVEGPSKPNPDFDDDVDQEGMREAVRTVKLVLSGSRKDVLNAAEQSKLKSTRQALYLHGAAEGDWVPAQEHVYSDGYRTLSHRSRAKTQSSHGFRVWVRPEEAADLPTQAEEVNEAGRQIQTVHAQRDGTQLVNGEIKVQGNVTHVAPSLDRWRVDNQPVKTVGIAGADVPVLIPNATKGTVVHLTKPVKVDCPYPTDSLPAFRALDLVRRMGVDTTDAVIQHVEGG